MTSPAEMEVLIPSRPFFRLKDVVEILGVEYQTVYSWTRGDAPILPTTQLGKVHLVSRPDLIRTLTRNVK
jgi:predicted site-specific integrase-resolvase